MDAAGSNTVVTICKSENKAKQLCSYLIKYMQSDHKSLLLARQTLQVLVPKLSTPMHLANPYQLVYAL